jgi:PST family polysaccharide transporter
MSSYRQVFKSTALVGGAQVITSLISLIQTKALAVMLGTDGMGLAGLYAKAAGLVSGIAGLGIGTSGVRQIAEASATGDERRVARTVRTLRYTALSSGIIGTLVVLVFCAPIARFTFGDDKHAWGMAVVSLTLLFFNVSSGQIALLQGLRRLKEMATAEVIGAVFGMVVSIVLVYFMRERGVAWFLVAIAAFSMLTSWWFARQVSVAKLTFHWRELMAEAGGLVRFGAAMMIAAQIGAGVDYLSQVLVVHQLGLPAAGLYQATWAISTKYVRFILNAMAADFIPRLTAAEKDHPAANRMMNEQVEMGVLIALPGVLATMLLAPWVLQAFYSKDFVAAADLIRWQVIGVFLRVVIWPVAGIMVAKGLSKLFIATEIIFAVVNVALLFGCAKVWGLKGVGISFAVFYMLYSVAMVFVCRHLTGFSWSGRSVKILLPGCMAIAAVFCATCFLPVFWSLVLGAALTIAVTIGCLAGLQKLLGVNLWQALRRKLQPETASST